MDQQGNPRDNKAAFWLTSSFSLKELHGERIKINWTGKAEPTGAGISTMAAASCGPTSDVFCLKADLAGVWLHFDQQDSDQIRRTNENPKAYTFIANLEKDRVREQNPALLKRIRHAAMTHA